MKYSEFKAEVEKFGLHLGVFESYVDVFDKHGDTVSRVAKEVAMGIDTEYEEFLKLPQEQRAGLFDLLYEIAKTPLAEREEEKRYRLRLSAPIVASDEYIYLTHIFTKDHYQLGSGSINDSTWKTIFTESEISQMDITGFQKVEVTE